MPTASLIDDTIKMAGRPITILRAAGNLSSFFWNGTFNRKGLEPPRSYERFFLIPSDSGIVTGDLIQDGTDFYLVMSLSREGEFGETWAFQGTLFKTNSVVSLNKYATGTQIFSQTKTGVNCLITRAHAFRGAEDDMAVLSSRSGRGSLWTLYARTSEGIDKGHTITDQDARDWRVTADSDPSLAGGIFTADIMLGKGL